MKKTRKDFIYEILCEFKKGLHVNEIAKEILKRNLENNVSEEILAAKTSAVLSQDIKKNKNNSRFKRISNKKGGYRQGWYRIKVTRKTDREKRITKIKGGKIEIPTIKPIYTGKAGEYAVLSELLFNEFNASLMSVDQGIDIVASKDNQFYYIQVKTANNRSGYFHASINKNQFERFNKVNTFYIFVLRYFLDGVITSDFIILRSFDLEKFKETKVISDGDVLNINITITGGTIILNGKEDISFHFNKFDSIKC